MSLIGIELVEIRIIYYNINLFFVLLFFLGFRRDNLKEKPEYLLKYISNDVYKKVLNNNCDYILDNLVDNRVDVDLNIRYLLSLGVKNIDIVVLERLDDLLLEHNLFIEKMSYYEKKLTKDIFIDMLENS